MSSEFVTTADLLSVSTTGNIRRTYRYRPDEWVPACIVREIGESVPYGCFSCSDLKASRDIKDTRLNVRKIGELGICLRHSKE